MKKYSIKVVEHHSRNSTIMEEKILKEIKQIRQLLSKLVGTSELPARQKFSKEANAKAAKEFQKMAIERGEWVPSNEIQKVIKHAEWRSDRIIIGKFGFTNYFKKGHTYYLNRKDLVLLDKELKARNSARIGVLSSTMQIMRWRRSLN